MATSACDHPSRRRAKARLLRMTVVFAETNGYTFYPNFEITKQNRE
jgi:hypothetical protein